MTCSSSDDDGLVAVEHGDDYDKQIDHCLRKTTCRRRGSEKKKKKGSGRDLLRMENKRLSRESTSSHGSHKSMSGASSKKNSSGKYGRSDAVRKKNRNAQRVFKELGTVLQVFDFGVGSLKVDEYPDDRTDVMGSMDETVGTADAETDRLIDEIAADALTELGIEEADAEPKGQWEQNLGLPLGEVLNQNGEKRFNGPVETPAHVKELCAKGEATTERLQSIKASQIRTPWSFGLPNALAESIVVMNEIVGEMRENCHEYGSSSSWSSASSGSSVCAEKDHALIQLLGILQDLYLEVVDSITVALKWIEEWFFVEHDFVAVADVSVQIVLKLITVLRQSIELEVMICVDGVGPAKVMKKEDMTPRKDYQLLSTINTINATVRKIQASLLKEGRMSSENGYEPPPDKVQLSDVVQQYWDGLKEITYRTGSCHPHLKEKIYKAFLSTLVSAVHSMTAIQDSEEVRRVTVCSKTVIADLENESSLMTDEEVASQDWMLPCLRKLHSVANQLAKQIRKSRCFKNKNDDVIEGNVLAELRNTFVELILVSVARMIRVTQMSAGFGLAQIEKRKDVGLKMLPLLSKYDHSLLSDNFEDDDRYDTFRELTTKLLNNVLCFQTKLQLHGIVGKLVPEHSVSVNSSAELSLDSKDTTCFAQLPVNPFSEDTPGSVRIGTLSSQGEEESTVESRDQTSISTGSIAMPNPFANAWRDGGVHLPNDFWEIRKPEEDRGHRNPLSDQESGSFKAHALSHITESIMSIGTSTTADPCPGMEQFYIINKSELVYGPRLGCGSTGQVFKMSFRGSPVAVKIMNSPGLLDTQQRLVHESEMHCRLAHHPNIVQFYGQCVGVDGTDQAVGLVMELCDVGSLLEVIRDARGIRRLEEEGHDMQRYEKTVGYAFCKNWPLRLKMACDVAAGMEFLHSRDIVHRDLTSYNVVISHGGRQGNVWTAKVCDFERSRHVPPGSQIPRSDTLPNSCAWSAPEILRNEDYSTQADVFSMGVVLWEILTLELPWRETRDAYHVMALVSNDARLPIPAPDKDSIPELSKLTDLVEEAWAETPNERPMLKDFHRRLFDIQKELVCRIRTQRHSN